MSEGRSSMRKHAAEILKRFSSARKLAALYPPDHPQVRVSAEALVNASEALLEGNSSYTLSIVGQDVYLDGSPLPEESETYEGLVNDLVARNLINISIDRGVTPDEWSAFLAWTAKKPEVIENEGGWQKIMAREDFVHIAVDRKIALDEMWNRKGTGSKFRVSREVYRKTIEATLASFAEARERQSLNLEMVDGVIRLLVSTVMDSEDMLKALSQIKGYDEYTLSHSVNVAVLSLLMGSKLKLPGPILHRLGVAALLHDIGKTSVPEDIINKNGKLTDREWEIMQSHSLAGSKILSEQKSVDQLAIVVAAEHHLREDLKGYPRFRSLKKLHMISRIVSVVDVYDALTSDRAYRRAEPPDVAMKVILDGRGTQFYPPAVKVFAQLTGMFPVGSMVELNTGQIGVVCKANPNDIFRPQVRLTGTAQSGSASFRLVNLSEKAFDGAHLHSIVRAVDSTEVPLDIADYF